MAELVRHSTMSRKDVSLPRLLIGLHASGGWSEAGGGIFSGNWVKSSAQRAEPLGIPRQLGDVDQQELFDGGSRRGRRSPQLKS